MSILEKRLAKLEGPIVQDPPPVSRFILKGAVATAEEQAAIQEAEALGHFVVVRSIISPAWKV